MFDWKQRMKEGELGVSSGMNGLLEGSPILQQGSGGKSFAPLVRTRWTWLARVGEQGWCLGRGGMTSTGCRATTERKGTGGEGTGASCTPEVGQGRGLVDGVVALDPVLRVHYWHCFSSRF